MAKRIRVWVETTLGRNEDDVELPDGWDEMSSDQQREYIDIAASEFRKSCVQCGGSMIEVDDETEGE